MENTAPPKRRYTTGEYSAEGTENGMIVDLSEHINKLVDYEDISGDLTEEQERKIVQYIKSCEEMSYNQIRKRYDHWREADRAHDVYVDPSATKFREKAVIADTRAVADTVHTYLMAALAGRNPMFQLEGQDRQSRKRGSILERVLHSQMRKSAGEQGLGQMLMDSIKYGFSPTQVLWDNKVGMNKIMNSDPRRTFPDPRVQWGDWDNMQYIVFVNHLSYNALVNSGLYPKLKMYPELRNRISAPNNGWSAHTWHQEQGRGLSIDPSIPHQRESGGQNYFALGNARVTDECWVRLSGYEIGVPGIEQIWLVVTILDEEVCIRFQINPYGQQFPNVIGGLYSDVHKTYGQSLYDLILPMHDIATWLLRSRVDNVQAALNNLIFADPTQVNIPDLIDRNPWGVVRTMPGVEPGKGVYIAQVPDVTRGHWNDIEAMGEMKKRVSAASDAQQGVPTASVRTATEIQRLTQLGSQRLGVLARTISSTTVRPMVRMMVSNIQDAPSLNGSVRIDEESMPSHLADVVKEGYIDYDVSDLQGEIDYLVIDGTLPIEPTRNAETWMNMLKIMSETGLSQEYKMGKISEEAIRALGVSDIEQFRISDEERAQGPSPSQQMEQARAAQGATVQPAGQVQDQVKKGNLVPLKDAPQRR